MKTLEQWEKRLSSLFTRSLRIIAEIPISIEDVEEIGQAVTSLIKSRGLRPATTILTKNFPLTFITLMANFAAYNTQQNYWQSFADFLEADLGHMNNLNWRKQFVNLAKNKKLRVFDFEDTNNPYVTSIRFQGGIPTYSLPDFFERIILPTIERKELREISPEKALNYMLDHALFVDSPVINFLRNSGKLGLEFFSEARRLIRHACENHGEILSADQVELPVYVVGAFENYWERREDELQHWRKPELVINPYSNESPFFLFLPEQEIKLEHVSKNIWWQIQIHDQPDIQKLPCKVFNKSPSLVVVGQECNIEKPVREIFVSIHTSDEEANMQIELRRWKLNLIPTNNVPLLVFRQNGRIIYNPFSLPAEALYLVSLVDNQLEFDGPAHRVEEPIALYGNWKEWRIEYWQLSKAWSLRLLKDNDQIGNAISIQGILELPQLEGGHLFQFQDNPDQPLYTSGLPSIKIPLRKILGTASDLNDWKIKIKSLWDANPTINEANKFGKYRSHIILEDGWALLPLSVILGEKAAGLYQIDIRGPRDIHETFRLRSWPRLLVVGLETEFQVPEEGKSFEFQILVPPNADCEIQPGMEHLTIEKVTGGFQITASGSRNLVKLFLTMPTNGDGQIRLPVTIHLPFPQWGLAADHNLGEVELDTTLENKSLDFMKQNQNAAIHVEMNGLTDKINQVCLQLFDQNDNETLLQEAKFSHTGLSKDWLRVGLNQFSDSIRQIHTSAVFKLVYTPRDRSREIIQIPILVLNRELEISNVKMVQKDNLTWKVTWQEEYPLKNRRLMLLPAWQPWQTPWEFKIPDDARGEVILKAISLPPNRYHLYFYVRASWQSELKEPPENINPFEINLCSPKERLLILEDNLLVLENNGSNANESYKYLIEQAVIYDFLNDSNKTGNCVTQAARHLLNLSNLDLLLGSLKWIESSRNIQPQFKSFYRNRIYHRQIVENLFRKYGSNHSTIKVYLQNINRIKNNLPADSSKLILEKVDDPIVIKTCLSALQNKKDEELPAIIVQLMRSAKLSKRDAVDILKDNPLWALERLDAINSGPYVDTVIARLLQKLDNQFEYQDQQRLLSWMIRALPYEEEPNTIKSYLEIMFMNHKPESYLILLNQFLAERISTEEVKYLLGLQPVLSFQFLHENHEPACWQDWCDYLMDNFPGAFGVIRKDVQLHTPLGIGKVVKIEIFDQEVSETTSLDPEGLRLSLVKKINSETILFYLDFQINEISVSGWKELRKCRHCDYVHPMQENVLKHSRNEHGVYAVDVIQFPHYFDKDDITFTK